jgi:hypothetical protein
MFIISASMFRGAFLGLFVGFVVTSNIAVAESSQCDAAQGNLVVNCGFETGDLTGWTPDGDQSFGGVDTFNPHTGTWAAYQGAIGTLGGFDQNITTTPNQSYDLSFWLYSDGGLPNEFQAYWGGKLLIDLTNIPQMQYTLYSFSGLLANGGSTDLEFLFRDDTGYLWFDDVIVVPAEVPEPNDLVLFVSACVGASFWLRLSQ